MNSILSRRSIRKYLPGEIDQATVKNLLAAAMAAPSAGNQQPWHFVIITDRATLDAIRSFHPHAAMVNEAPLAILVCGDETLEKHKGYWVQDCSAAVENLLIAVQEAALGAVWLGVYPREDRVRGFRRLLAIPEQVTPFACIPVGRPAEKKPPSNRYNEARIHYNKW